MTSWQTLLLLHLAQGRYLSTRPPTEYDWMILWALGAADSVNPPRHTVTKDTGTLTCTSVP